MYIARFKTIDDVKKFISFVYEKVRPEQAETEAAE